MQNGNQKAVCNGNTHTMEIVGENAAASVSAETGRPQHLENKQNRRKWSEQQIIRWIRWRSSLI